MTDTMEAEKIAPPTKSRAAFRSIEGDGMQPVCPGCEKKIIFQAKIPLAQRIKVVCNVYKKGKWSHVEHWHDTCYAEAGNPHGEPAEWKRFGSIAGPYANRKKKGN